MSIVDSFGGLDSDLRRLPLRAWIISGVNIRQPQRATP